MSGDWTDIDVTTGDGLGRHGDRWF